MISVLEHHGFVSRQDCGSFFLGSSFPDTQVSAFILGSVSSLDAIDSPCVFVYCLVSVIITWDPGGQGLCLGHSCMQSMDHSAQHEGALAEGCKGGEGGGGSRRLTQLGQK